MDSFNQPSRYQVYVLRLWQEQIASPERPAIWRFTLEDPKTKERRGFDELGDLLAFLSAEIEGTTPRPKMKRQ